MSEIGTAATAEALHIVSRAGFTGDAAAFEVLATAIQRHMDRAARWKRLAQAFRKDLRTAIEGSSPDELPAGWSDDGSDDFIHVSGAEVSLRELPDGTPSWCWWPADGPSECKDPKATREEAMAAALASVEPRDASRVCR